MKLFLQVSGVECLRLHTQTPPVGTLRSGCYAVSTSGRLCLGTTLRLVGLLRMCRCLSVWPFCKPCTFMGKLQGLSSLLLTWLIAFFHILTSVMTHEMKPKRNIILLHSGNVLCVCCDHCSKDRVSPYRLACSHQHQSSCSRPQAQATGGEGCRSSVLWEAVVRARQGPCVARL